MNGRFPHLGEADHLAILGGRGRLRRWWAQRHVEACPECRAELRRYEAIHAAVQDAMRERELTATAQSRGRASLKARMDGGAPVLLRQEIAREILGSQFAGRQAPSRLEDVLGALAGAKAASSFRE